MQVGNATGSEWSLNVPVQAVVWLSLAARFAGEPLRAAPAGSCSATTVGCVAETVDAGTASQSQGNAQRDGADTARLIGITA
jgi:hypothetical protein